MTELSPVFPLNPYARSKVAGEGIVQDILPESWRCIIARPFNHTGPGQSTNFALPSFASQIVEIERRKRAFIEVGDLSTRRDILDVRDVIAAYRVIIEKGRVLPSGTVINICRAETFSVRELLDQLCALAKCPVTVRVAEKHIRASMHSNLGSNDCLRDLGWCPSISITETLKDMLGYWRSII